MRPFIVHIIILSGLVILGIALFTMEALTTQTGGWLIKKFTATKLYWFGFIVYSLISTFIVLFVGLYYKIKKRPFTNKNVILSHIIPVGLVWIFVSFGFHDLIQDAWEKNLGEFKPTQKQISYDQSNNKRSPIPPTPLRKKLEYKTSDKPVESKMQERK